MPDFDGVLLIATLAVIAIVLGGGAMQTWRDWSYDRRIRKHLRR
jgi:hypothetical protein